MMASSADADPEAVKPIRLVFDNLSNPGLAGEDLVLRCVGLLRSGSPCSKLLRDANGCQARDDVSCSRRGGQHVL